MSKSRTTRKVYNTTDLEKRLANCPNMPELRSILDVIKQDPTSTAPPYEAYPERTFLGTVKLFANYLSSLRFRGFSI